MKRLAWTTDPHLNFVSREEVEAFYRRVAEAGPDAVLLGGDIGEADTLTRFLDLWTSWIACPIYFVLGNHDFYRGSIASVRAKVEALLRLSSCL